MQSFVSGVFFQALNQFFLLLFHRQCLILTNLLQVVFYFLVLVIEWGELNYMVYRYFEACVLVVIVDLVFGGLYTFPNLYEVLLR